MTAQSEQVPRMFARITRVIMRPLPKGKTMTRKRIQLTVSVDLDNMVGTFFTEESARDVVEKILMDRIEHYNPTVLIQSEE